MSRSRATRLASLISLLLVAYVLRVYRLGAQNIWWDEGLAIWAVRKTLVDTTLWTATDVHPPLYFWLLWPWVRLVGETEFAARYITLIYGLLTVALGYAVGTRLAHRRVGLLSAGLIALSRFQVWWSQEMRMYMLAGLMGLASVCFLVQIVADEGRSNQAPARGSATWRSAARLRKWLVYVIATIGALYTIYLSLAFVIIENLWVMAIVCWGRLRRRWAFLRGWVIAQITIVALMLPWLAIALPRMRSWRIIEEPPSLRFVAQLYATLVATGVSTYLGNVWLPTAIITLIGITGLMAIMRPSGHLSPAGPRSLPAPLCALLLTLLVVVPVILVWLITQPRSIFYSPRVEARYLLPFAAPAYILLAWGLVALHDRRPWPSVAALAVVLALSLWTLPQHYGDRYLRDDLQTMAQVIRAYARPGDAVLLISGNRYPVFLYYYNQAFKDAPVHPPVYPLPQGSETFTEENVGSELSPLVAQYDRLWLAWVNGPMQDPAGLAEAWLNARQPRVLSLGFAHNALHLYAQEESEPTVPETNLAAIRPLRVHLGRAEILGYDLSTVEFRPGDAIRLGLYARTLRPARIAVRWVPGDGPPLAEYILELPATDGAVIRRRVEFHVSEAVPASAYHFELAQPDEASATTFGRHVVARTNAAPRDAAPDHALGARIGTAYRFLGYSLRDGRNRPVNRLRSGQTVYLDLYWQAEARPGTRYTAFTHLLGQAHNPATNGPVWAGHDSEPLMGAVPTTRWPVGVTLADRHPLTVDPAAPPGKYSIEIGLYDPDTGARLPVAGAGADPDNKRLLLGTVEVARPCPAALDGPGA